MTECRYEFSTGRYVQNEMNSYPQSDMRYYVHHMGIIEEFELK